jgi:hypothetical protein
MSSGLNLVKIGKVKKNARDSVLIKIMYICLYLLWIVIGMTIQEIEVINNKFIEIHRFVFIVLNSASLNRFI